MIENLGPGVNVPVVVLIALYAYRGEGKEMYEIGKGRLTGSKPQSQTGGSNTDP